MGGDKIGLSWGGEKLVIRFFFLFIKETRDAFFKKSSWATLVFVSFQGTSCFGVVFFFFFFSLGHHQ